MKLKEIKDIIPKDFSRHCVRDVSVFTCSIFGETYVRSFRELWGIEFSAVLWVVRNRNMAIFYRSRSEHDHFDEVMGKRMMKKEFASGISGKLKSYTDWLNRFMKEKNRKELFLANKKEFVDAYRTFFAYHQAVYWGGDFICRNNPKFKEIIGNLDSAYKYNEMVIPDIEAYLADLGVDHLRYDDAEGNVGDRGLLFLNSRKKEEFFGDELDELEEFIKSKEKSVENLKVLKGIGIYKGKVKGNVKLITDLNSLGDVEQGSILVTMMTRPQFNKQIKNARAIVTDEGGMLCHASILAREARIPSVVGTKTATKFLKGGDLIEVDADKGTIKILERR